MMIIHCRMNDITNNLSVNQLMSKVSVTMAHLFKIMKSELPASVLAWSDVIHRCVYKNLSNLYGDMLVNNMNIIGQMCMVIQDYPFIPHPGVHPEFTHMFRFKTVSTDHLHLSAMGYHAWFVNLDKAVSRYFPTVPLMEMALTQKRTTYVM